MIKKLKKPVVWIPCAMLFVLIAHHVIMVTWFPYSKYGCERKDVDLTTGRLRYTEYSWYMKCAERIEDTAVSDIMYNTQLGAKWVEFDSKRTSKLVIMRWTGSSPLPYHINQVEDYWSHVESRYHYEDSGFKKRMSKHVLSLIEIDITGSLIKDYLSLVRLNDYFDLTYGENCQILLNSAYNQVVKNHESRLK